MNPVLMLLVMVLVSVVPCLSSSDELGRVPFPSRPVTAQREAFPIPTRPMVDPDLPGTAAERIDWLAGSVGRVPQRAESPPMPTRPVLSAAAAAAAGIGPQRQRTDPEQEEFPKRPVISGTISAAAAAAAAVGPQGRASPGAYYPEENVDPRRAIFQDEVSQPMPEDGQILKHWRLKAVYGLFLPSLRLINPIPWKFKPQSVSIRNRGILVNGDECVYSSTEKEAISSDRCTTFYILKLRLTNKDDPGDVWTADKPYPSMDGIDGQRMDNFFTLSTIKAEYDSSITIIQVEQWNKSEQKWKSIDDDKYHIEITLGFTEPTPANEDDFW